MPAGAKDLRRVEGFLGFVVEARGLRMGRFTAEVGCVDVDVDSVGGKRGIISAICGCGTFIRHVVGIAKGPAGMKC